VGDGLDGARVGVQDGEDVDGEYDGVDHGGGGGPLDGECGVFRSYGLRVGIALAHVSPRSQEAMEERTRQTE
jgi:hypothetical protein